MMRQYIDLYTLQSRITSGIAEFFPDKIWIKAEISSISARPNGHCYLELSQSDEGGIVAKARAVIWRNKYPLLSACFKETVGAPLQQGMSILACVQVSHSELYGMTLVIEDLDAEVALGARERARRETIEKLTSDGMMEKQQGLSLPLLPYSLAVISARDAAGYGDFCHHLLDNEYGFRFRVDLFEASMQGANSPESIVDALESVQTCGTRYDAILIMRGGGSNIDLDCYDDYGLALGIANCSIPVFTAIGHDRDYHVADMVAFRFVKTPTALADELLDCYMSEDERISSYLTRLRLALNSKLASMSSMLENLSSRIRSADPRNILARGYTLAADAEGVVRKSAARFGEGDHIRVLFADGSLICEVKEKLLSCKQDGEV